MRGRKPLPTAIKVARGNPGHRPLPKNEPQPSLPLDPDDYPAWFGEIAKGEWIRLSTALLEAGVLAGWDRGVLIAACVEWERFIEAQRRVQQLGAVMKSPKAKALIQNPYLSIANGCVERLLKLWAELGLTPSSRTRIHARAPKSTAKPSKAERYILRAIQGGKA